MMIDRHPNSKSTQDSQATRNMEWVQPDSPDGPLVLEGFEISERLSGLFRGQVRLSAAKSAASRVKPESIVGTAACLRLDLPVQPEPAVSERYLHAMVSRFALISEDAARVYYQADLVPAAWLLSQTSDCRIFQQMTVVEVALALLAELKQDFPELVDYANQTTHNYPVRDCVVQYNETDLNFFERLLQEEGIYYYFEHTADGHRLVLSDAVTFPTCHGQPVASQKSRVGENEDGLRSWTERLSFTPGQYAVADRHFQRADALIDSSQPTKFETGGNQCLEVYEYSGRFTRQGHDSTGFDAGQLSSEARRVATMRIEAEECQRQSIQGTSHCRAFLAGYQFQREMISGDPDPAGPYLLTEVHHVARQPGYRSGSANRTWEYQNRFTCMAASLPFRPQRTTARPVISSVQTATVEGPDGQDVGAEEIHVDEFGRIKVRFPWDRRGREDDGMTSAWIRVGQSMAGGNYGAFFWPRVGHEVIVAFENGDPDRPIVVGSVYNNVNMPPYALPEHKTRSGIKTKSTKKGDHRKHYNELRFEDKKGKEQIYVHAERNLDTVVEASEKHRVCVSRTTEVGPDPRSQDAPDEFLEDLTVHGNRKVSIDGMQLVTVGRGMHTAVFDETLGYSVAAVADVEIKSVTKGIQLNAMTGIELVVGPNSIKIDQNGIWINGMNVGIKSKMMASMHGAISCVTSASTTTVNAPVTNILSTGTLTLKGAAAGMTY